MSEEKKAESAKETQETEAKAAPEAEAKQSNTYQMDAGLGGVVGVKAGMTQVYDEAGNQLAVTVIDVQPNVITQIKNPEKDGYVGVQVGVFSRKENKCNRAERGHAKKSGHAGFSHYQEFRLPKNTKVEAQPGQSLGMDFLKAGDLVDLTSYSKGKGFQGAMKRHNFRGLSRTHGVSVSHRSHGSTGNRADPGKVFKNKKMAGHMGNRQVTLQNSRVVRVDKENNLILVHGSVPGSRSSLVTIRRAVKTASPGCELRG